MATIKGGERLALALAELGAQVTKPGTLQVGFLAGATYPDGKPVAMIAAIQNFGAPAAGIPPRPFFSNMVADKAPTWGKALATNLKQVKYDAPKALLLMGEGIAGQLRQSIKNTNAPPLAPSTIARKGFAKPLVDTGHMQNSIDYQVRT